MTNKEVTVTELHKAFVIGFYCDTKAAFRFICEADRKMNTRYAVDIGMAMSLNMMAQLWAVTVADRSMAANCLADALDKQRHKLERQLGDVRSALRMLVAPVRVQ